DRVAMVRVLGSRFDQLRHNVRRSRFVRISHPKVDNVLAGAPRLQAQFSNRVEDVGWQPLDSWEIHRAISFNGRPLTPLVGMSHYHSIAVTVLISTPIPSISISISSPALI